MPRYAIHNISAPNSSVITSARGDSHAMMWGATARLARGCNSIALAIATSTTMAQVERYIHFSHTVRSSRNQYPQNINHRPICNGGSMPKPNGVSSEREPTHVV